MFKCLIIDDEELARSLLKTYVDKLDFLELIGSYENPLEAISTLNEKSIDVVFLDIQMPDLKGTDLAKLISSDTKVIFTTAYADYALEGYELNVLDYLLKPITFERFLKAVHKLKDTDIYAQDTLTVKSGYDWHKLRLEEILYIESDSEYVVFHTSQQKLMSHQSLKSLEKTLNPLIFIRVHRSYIVNRKKVTALKGRDLLISEIRIPVSDSYYERVKRDLF
ncbi:MAG: LytTR family DNA-binding domain-containing protein [Bacteroidota bacterium]